MTANGSSSSVQSPTDLLRVDLEAAGLLAPLPAALLAGRDRDLLEPLRFLDPGALPPGRPSAVDRSALAAALAVSNRSDGHPEADALARRLADPATRVVVTGQQPGLLGGPLYTLSKAVAAARWAAALEAAGEPAVAVFWVATEDHDYAEVASATVLTTEGPRTFDLGPDPEPLLPVGMRALGPAIDDVLAGIAAAVPGSWYGEWLQTVARWYRPDARFGEAFCRLLAHLLGPRCPLLLDAMLPALKSAERPWLRRLIEQRNDMEAAYAERDAAIAARGHELQVAPQRGASPLFLLQGKERRRIEWRDGDRFALRGKDDARSVADLLQIVDDNPGVVSPGVLARPFVQDAVLGTTLQVLGPGEMSYIAQVAALYPLFGVEAPSVALRPQAMVLDSHQAGKVADTGLALADLLGDASTVDRALAERS
ncbi:MAG TPA: bacillithiol biosynthesis BshC, partial [Thermoanaerobaculia bacterium]